MHYQLSLLFCGVLLLAGGGVQAQQRAGEEHHEVVKVKHDKGRAKLRGWQRPGHPGRGHAYGRGKHTDVRGDQRRSRPFRVRQRPDAPPPRLPRRALISG